VVKNLKNEPPRHMPLKLEDYLNLKLGEIVAASHFAVLLPAFEALSAPAVLVVSALSAAYSAAYYPQLPSFPAHIFAAVLASIALIFAFIAAIVLSTVFLASQTPPLEDNHPQPTA